MNRFHRCALLIVIMMTGCASRMDSSGMAVESAYLEPSQDRTLAQAAMTGSLFKEDEAVISNQNLSAILETKLTVPQNAKIAVLQFGPTTHWRYWSSDFVRGNEEIDKQFFTTLGEAKNVKHVAYLPPLITPREMTIPYLRQAAARFQADYLLLYRTSTRRYERDRLFSKNEVRAYCTIEAILLDTRSGLIPFGTVITEEFSARKTSKDISFQETIAKAEQQALGKGWVRLAQQTKEHLDKM